jgi:hypothetical protein
MFFSYSMLMLNKQWRYLGICGVRYIKVSRYAEMSCNVDKSIGGYHVLMGLGCQFSLG